MHLYVHMVILYFHFIWPTLNPEWAPSSPSIFLPRYSPKSPNHTPGTLTHLHIALTFQLIIKWLFCFRTPASVSCLFLPKLQRHQNISNPQKLHSLPSIPNIMEPSPLHHICKQLTSTFLLSFYQATFFFMNIIHSPSQSTTQSRLPDNVCYAYALTDGGRSFLSKPVRCHPPSHAGYLAPTIMDCHVDFLGQNVCQGVCPCLPWQQFCSQHDLCHNSPCEQEHYILLPDLQLHCPKCRARNDLSLLSIAMKLKQECLFLYYSFWVEINKTYSSKPCQWHIWLIGAFTQVSSHQLRRK